MVAIYRKYCIKESNNNMSIRGKKIT